MEAPWRRSGTVRAPSPPAPLPRTDLPGICPSGPEHPQADCASAVQGCNPLYPRLRLMPGSTYLLRRSLQFRCPSQTMPPPHPQPHAPPPQPPPPRCVYPPVSWQTPHTANPRHTTSHRRRGCSLLYPIYVFCECGTGQERLTWTRTGVVAQAAGPRVAHPPPLLAPPPQAFDCAAHVPNRPLIPAPRAHAQRRRHLR